VATGSTVATIAAANRLRHPNEIQVGQVLRVPI
jgi:nucleoid-associated protein YgaU